ncbi:MAG: isoaspartyl peptidase/L-asparaginase [Nitrospirota bacterium]
MILFGVVVHGGAGSSAHFTDGCKAACESAFNLLEAGRSALDAVVEAARVLEDDDRFNAGSGSVLRMDGKTIEMDAAVMDSRGNIGIVIAIRDVKNPILVARAVMETPHVALTGQGATAFAKRRGFAPFHQVSQKALKQYERVRQLIKENRLSELNPRWQGYDVESLWNFDDVSYKDVFSCKTNKSDSGIKGNENNPLSPPFNSPLSKGGYRGVKSGKGKFSRDTIGAVAIDKDGKLAVANSTGGSSPMMLGRVGDSPIVGCGFYAGSACAVVITGVGEEIIKRMLAKTVYDMIFNGEDVKTACEKGVNMFPPEIIVGIIAISRRGYAVMSNTEIANYILVKEE